MYENVQSGYREFDHSGTLRIPTSRRLILSSIWQSAASPCIKEARKVAKL